MRATMNKEGLKYRGCLSDCEGCCYQVKAVVGRQHGCNLCWETRDGDYSKCPVNRYWVGMDSSWNGTPFEDIQ